MKISNSCNNCGICEILCPYQAIYPRGINWRKVQNKYLIFCDEPVNADDFRSLEHYYIVPDKCTECVGKYPEPICAAACSISCLDKDKSRPESEEHLFAKKEYLETMAGRT
jgi:ferredoxin